MTQSQMAGLEGKAIPVDSEHIEKLTYIVDKDRKGIYIDAGPAGMIAIAAEYVDTFTKELIQIWDMHGRR